MYIWTICGIGVTLVADFLLYLDRLKYAHIAFAINPFIVMNIFLDEQYSSVGVFLAPALVHMPMVILFFLLGIAMHYSKQYLLLGLVPPFVLSVFYAISIYIAINM